MPKGDLLIGLETPLLDDDPDRPAKHYVDEATVTRHAAWFFAASVLAFVALGTLLSVSPCLVTTRTGWSEVSLLLIAMVAAAMGGLIHALTSFTDFAGNRQLVSSWVPWLYLRPAIGALLGVIVYFGLRAGEFGGVSDASTCKGLYLVALTSALAGLFSKQAADKLSDIVENLLASPRQPERVDSLEKKDDGGKAVVPVVGGRREDEFDATVQRVQQLLLERGYLADKAPNGARRDNGLLDEATRAAIDKFLAEHGIVGKDRAQTVGEDFSPDFWPKLIDLISQAPRRP